MLLTALLIIEARTVFGDVQTASPGGTNVTGQYKAYTFFATSTTQNVGGVNAYGTTTVDTSAGVDTFATSTNIASWINSSGQVDTGYFVVAGSKQVVFYFSRGATSTNNGSSLFTVQVTPDGTNWYNYNTLLPNTATSTPSSQTTITVPSGTSTVAAYMQNTGFYGVRCIAGIVKDGVDFCKAAATW